MQIAMLAEPHLVTEEESAMTYSSAESVDRTFWGDAAPHRSPANHSWEFARDGLEDIGNLRITRHPRGHETWDQPHREERRLLAQLDAVLACGPLALARARDSVLYETDAPPDPEWLFAVTLALACDGESTGSDALLRVFRHACTLDATSAEAVVEALCLAPAGATPTLHALVRDGTPAEVMCAAQVLTGRGELDESEVSPLLLSREAATVVTALEAALDRGYASPLAQTPDFFTHHDETVVRAALRLGFAANLAGTRQRVLELCGRSPEYADALLSLALFGDHADRPIFEHLCHERNLIASRAASYWGYVEIIPVLLDILRTTDGAKRVQVAEALERITGSGLYTPRDLDEESNIDPEEYDQWWNSHATYFSPSVRYRGGRLHGPHVLIDDLSAAPMNPADRMLVHLELTARSTLPAPRFRPWDFIARQRTSIRLWRERFDLPRN